MKNAAEHLAEIRDRIAAVVAEYDWGDLRASPELHVHEAAADAMIHAEAALGVEMHQVQLSGTNLECDVVTGEDRCVIVYGKHRPMRGDPRKEAA